MVQNGSELFLICGNYIQICENYFQFCENFVICSLIRVEPNC